MLTEPLENIRLKLDTADVNALIDELSKLAAEKGSLINGFAPIIHIALLPPNTPLSSFTNDNAISLFDSLFSELILSSSIQTFLERCLVVFETTPAYLDSFLFITNELSSEYTLWQIAYSDTEEAQNAQQTILNYIESNTAYPFSGGVEPTDEEALGLKPPRPILYPVPDGIRTDKDLKRLPTRRTLKPVVKPQMYDIVTDGKQKVYGLISIFVSASALYVLQKQMTKRK